LARSELSETERQAIGRIHPTFIGGEYLPDLSQNEVMIASITIASTTQDVASVYAFYAETGPLCGRRIKAWAAARRADLGLNQIDEEALESAATAGSDPNSE